MRALDVVVHASTEPEPFGLVIAEGMACGACRRLSAPPAARPRSSQPGVNALTHDPGDAAGLAERIRSLVADAALRVRVGGRGTRRGGAGVRPRTRLVGQLHSVYETLAIGRV